MRNQMKAAIVGVVLATVVFVGTPAKADCPGCASFTSLDWSCNLYGCDWAYPPGDEPYVTACHFYCRRYPLDERIGEICDNRGESPKQTEPAEDQNKPVKNSRSDSR